MLALTDLVRDDELPRFLDILDRWQVTKTGRRDDEPKTDADRYAEHRDRVGRRQKQASKSGRDIGPLPPVVDPERKARCERSLRNYLLTYHPNSFGIPFSADHERIIAKIQTAVLIGLRQALAMPRGSGKTTICQCAAQWSAIYGHHLYQMLLQANEKKAAESLQIIVLEFETNELLHADFPEVCYPVQCLERIAQRAKGQTYQGQPTHLVWSGDKLVLPTIPGSKASGAVLYVAGLQEAVRGALLFHPSLKRRIRPSLALIDDPQTRLSAKSQEECDTREKVIAADLLGMAGPGEPFSALMPCTIIEPGDVAERFLDRERNPEWRGERCQMLYQFPDNLELWTEYDAIRRRELKTADDVDPQSAADLFAESTAFYREHQPDMDAGAVVAWPDRKYPWELSAIQHALTLWLSDPETFASEYQNDPQSALEDSEDVLAADDIARKLSGLDRYQIPEGSQYLTAHIDVHKRILFYTVAAYSPHFDGAIVDYGVFPDQRHGHFTERTARPTLQEKFPGRGMEGAIYAGLEALCKRLFSLNLNRDDGAQMPIDLCLIDAGWKPDIVFKYCAASPYKGRVAPSIGRPFGPNDKPLSRCKPRKNEHIGLEWTIPPTTGRQVRNIQFDANWWKTFFHGRLSTPIGDRGSLNIFGQLIAGSRPSVDHTLYARHLAAEFSQPVQGRFQINVWRQKPGAAGQNHFLDTAVATAVAASVKGATLLPELKAPKTSSRRKIHVIT